MVKSVSPEAKIVRFKLGLSHFLFDLGQMAMFHAMFHTAHVQNEKNAYVRAVLED